MVEFDERHGPDDEWEQALRSALRPRPAPEGFANRVLARSQELPPAESPAFRKRFGFHPVLRWAIAAVLLLTVSIGGFAFHQRQRRIAGERARDQVLLALRITSITIRAVRNQVGRDSHNTGQQGQQETP